MRSRPSWLWFCPAVLCASAALAQQSANPGRVDERLRPRPDAPGVEPLDLPDQRTQAAAPDSSIRVALTAIRFEGATAVPQADLEAIAAPYLGREMPLAEVFRLAEEVTAEYRRRGFVLARAVVGPQRIENGVLTIQVVEGFVDQTRIEGDPGGYRPFLDAYLRPVREGRPARGDDLGRALLLARDLRGAEVLAVLTPSPAVAGASNLTLVVERRPFEGYLALDNRGSRWLGPLQLYAGASLNDLAGLGERLNLSTVFAPDQGGELDFVSGSWEQPLGGSGLRADLFGSYVTTEPGDELRDLGVQGESLTYGLGLQYPFLRSREANVLGRMAFTARDSNSGNFFLDPLYVDETRTVAIELFANQATPWGAYVTSRVALTQGLDALGATAASDTRKSRATGSGQFARVNAEVSWTQSLFAGLRFTLAGAAQLTPDSLLASEEFGVGGALYGRAYDPSEITGDEGYAAKAELFYSYPERDLGTIEPFVYYDGGQVRQNDPLPGEARRASLESVGGGIRVNLDRGYAASFEYAKPIGRDVAANRDRDGRVFVSVAAQY